MAPAVAGRADVCGGVCRGRALRASLQRHGGESRSGRGVRARLGPTTRGTDQGMRRVTPSGQAGAGDLISDGLGGLYEVVSVNGAHEVINAVSERAPIVWRGSFGERC